jgi:GNAT superfamily N-acetyltransferase
MTPKQSALFSRQTYPVLFSGAYSAEVLVLALPLLTRSNPRLLPSGTFHVAKNDNGEIVGCGGWSFERPGSGEVVAGMGHIRHFATHPDWTRRGIGRALLSRCIGQAIEPGVGILECQSSPSSQKRSTGHRGSYRLRKSAWNAAKASARAKIAHTVAASRAFLRRLYHVQRLTLAPSHGRSAGRLGLCRAPVANTLSASRFLASFRLRHCCSLRLRKHSVGCGSCQNSHSRNLIVADAFIHTRVKTARQPPVLCRAFLADGDRNETAIHRTRRFRLFVSGL